MFKVITLIVQVKCTNCTIGVQTFISHRIFIFLYFLKYFPQVINTFFIKKMYIYFEFSNLFIAIGECIYKHFHFYS